MPRPWHILLLMLCLLLRAAAGVCSYIHIISYASYAGLDWLALKLSGAIDE